MRRSLSISRTFTENSSMLKEIEQRLKSVEATVKELADKINYNGGNVPNKLEVSEVQKCVTSMDIIYCTVICNIVQYIY